MAETLGRSGIFEAVKVMKIIGSFLIGLLVGVLAGADLQSFLMQEVWCGEPMENCIESMADCREQLIVCQNSTKSECIMVLTRCNYVLGRCEIIGQLGGCL